MPDQVNLYFYTDDGKIAGSISAETPESADKALAWFKANTDFVADDDGAAPAEKPKRTRKSKKSASDDGANVQASEPEPEKAPEPAKPTRDDVANALKELCTDDAGSRAMVDMLRRIFGMSESEQPRLSLIPEGRFAEVIEEATKLKADIQAKAAATADVLG